MAKIRTDTQDALAAAQKEAAEAARAAARAARDTAQKKAAREAAANASRRLRELNAEAARLASEIAAQQVRANREAERSMKTYRRASRSAELARAVDRSSARHRGSVNQASGALKGSAERSGSISSAKQSSGSIRATDTAAEVVREMTDRLTHEGWRVCEFHPGDDGMDAFVAARTPTGLRCVLASEAKLHRAPDAFLRGVGSILNVFRAPAVTVYSCKAFHPLDETGKTFSQVGKDLTTAMQVFLGEYAESLLERDKAQQKLFETSELTEKP